MFSYWFLRRAIAFFCGLVVSQAYAVDYRGLGWVAVAAPANCTMTQVLPDLGKVILSQTKQKTTSLIVVLQEKSIFSPGPASIKSLPPLWRNDLTPINLGELNVVAGKQPISTIDSTLLAAIVAQLNDGINVVIHSPSSEELGLVDIVLDAKGFSSALKKHRDCTGEAVKSSSLSALLSKVILQASHSSISGRLYAADIKRAGWKLLSNPFVCSMTHDIPELGKAVFMTRATGTQQFYLELQEGVIFPQGSTSIDTFPAPWRNTVAPIFVARVTASEGKQPITLAMEDSFLLEKYLAKGVSLLLTSEPVAKGVTRVVLDAKNFLAENKRYKQCADDLIPFTFAQIARLVFNYPEKSDGLTSAMQTDLAKVVRYMKADASVLGVLIDVHSDNARTVDASEAVTKKHAEWVAAFLTEKGIGSDKITLRWHGDKYPIANNDTPEGRVKNRRITVRMETQPMRSDIEKRSAQKKLEDEKKAIVAAAEKAQAEKAQAEKVLSEQQKPDKSIKTTAQAALKAATTQSNNEKVTPDDIHTLVEGLELIEKQK
jgi:sodium-type flagellar protein MotY